MRAYGKYISKFLVSFIAVLLMLALSNLAVFFWMFRQVVSSDYGETAPRRMLEKVSEVATEEGIPAAMREELHSNRIWAMFLSADGTCLWEADLPEGIPTSYTIQDVAMFTRGYLNDYPVFVWAEDSGLLVLGYPRNSFFKITGNYYSARMIEILPLFAAVVGAFDIIVIFLSYILSKRNIVKSTEPIISSIEALSNGTPVTLSIKGELSSVAESVNRTSKILERQNQARANWISGVSHDIRTPLSIIMGYADRIAASDAANEEIRKQAELVRRQSVKIKELVKDLNLVSQLEYEMQPLCKETVRLSKLLRAYLAEQLNLGLAAGYSIEIDIAPEAEQAVLVCDARLITRAVHNLVQNSLGHNPQGCNVLLALKTAETQLILSVTDDGTGLSVQKRKELEEKPHYLESTDSRLDLRHGLGLLLVRQIAAAHQGDFRIENVSPHGCRAVLIFPYPDGH